MKKIILITHMPCTAGTFYTHFISKVISKKSLIIPETNPNAIFYINKKSILPYSINAAGYQAKAFDYNLYVKNYKKELDNLIDFFEKSNSEILTIRDHAWSEFNNINYDIKTPILSKLLDKENIKYDPILTVRDPVDSFIALKKNFPKIDINLNQYSQIYNNFLFSWRNYYKNRLLELKIEDFVQNKEKVENLLNNRFKLKDKIILSGVKIEKNELSSGASGRKAIKPFIFKRRPYSLFAHLEFNNNKKFKNLRRNLNYENKVKYESFFEMLLSLFHSFYQPIINLKLLKNKSLKNYLNFEFLTFF